MSKATKRKHVVKEVLGDYVQPTEQQRIVKVLGSPGNNLHEVETSEGERFLASMPTKFRRNIWIKRGDFLIVDPIEEGEKVKAEIAFILYKDHQLLLQKEGLWPPGFNGKNTEPAAKNKESNKVVEAQPREKREGEESESDSEDDSDLFVNTNRVNYEDSEEESESEEEEDEGEEK